MTDCATHGNERVLGCSQCMAALRITSAVKAGRIAFMPDDEIEALRPEVDKLLDALGVRGWMSNESTLSDFHVPMLTRAGFILGMELKKGDLIVDIAQRLRDRR